VRVLRTSLVIGGILAVFALAYHLGAESVVSALEHITWWQFALICLVHGVAVILDAYGWRYTLTSERVPFLKLVAARCAGDAINVLTAVASVGGDAIKPWLLRHDLPYEETIASVILSKTAEVVSQLVLLAIAVLVGASMAAFDPSLLAAMGYMLLIEIIAVGGLVGVQTGGMVARAGQILAWAGLNGVQHARRLDTALRGFYREEWRRFLLAVGLYFLAWLLGVFETFLVLESLALPGSLMLAIVLEALWSAVRFTTFFVPASLGPLEGANAAAFDVLGFGSGTGLAFTLVRRARQAVWVGVGLLVLIAMRPAPSLAGEQQRLPAV
jgi:glycosyltransferase 2 family protein